MIKICLWPYLKHSDEDGEFEPAKKESKNAKKKKRIKKSGNKETDSSGKDLNLLVMDSDEEDRKHFDYKEIVKTDNMSKKKLKKLKKKEKVIHLT